MSEDRSGHNAAVSSAMQQLSGAAAGKYLTFRLANEEYGIEILKVQEIIGLMSITKMPRTPVFVRGVINLRGKVIPVIDLRLKFSMEGAEDTEETCIIVVDVSQGSDDVRMGLLVDSVCEVADVEQEQIEKTPELGGEVDTRFISGMGKIGERVVILLDIDLVLSDSRLRELKND